MLDEALLTYDSILSSSEQHSLTDEIYFSKSNIFLKQNNLDKTVLMLRKNIEEFPHDILADDATFQLAKIYESKLNNITEAMKLYESILINYQGSIYTMESRKKYRNLRGDYKEVKTL